ncbi:MAG: basic amino acid ABC transporter substrate-binding protein [Selenomonadaceae bacterium]|nr:basic amino acid ABC transporter substrate-binding protein [Selenomonadaceae bacterium]
MNKKILALFFSGLLVISAALTGCGGNAKGDKVLKAACSADFAPFEFQEEGNKEYQGFDMDLIRALAKEMGMEVEISNIAFDGLIPALEAGNIDVAISGMTINDERKGKVLFSDPYYESGLTLVVRSDEKNIKGFKDLEGKSVAAQIGTTGSTEASKIKDCNVKNFNVISECFMELKAKGVDAVINDRPVNDYYIKKTNSEGVKALPEKLTAENYGMAVRKDNKELQEKLNAALKKLKDNGEYQKIHEKWFGGASK